MYEKGRAGFALTAPREKKEKGEKEKTMFNNAEMWIMLIFLIPSGYIMLLCLKHSRGYDEADAFVCSGFPLTYVLGYGAYIMSTFNRCALFYVHILAANSVLFLTVWSMFSFLSCLSTEGKKLDDKYKTGLNSWCGAIVWIGLLLFVFHPMESIFDVPYVRFSHLFATSSVETSVEPPTIYARDNNSGGLDVQIVGGGISSDVEFPGGSNFIGAPAGEAACRTTDTPLKVQPAGCENFDPPFYIVRDRPGLTLRFATGRVENLTIMTSGCGPVPFELKDDEIVIDRVPSDEKVILTWPIRHGYRVRAVVSRYPGILNFVNGPLLLGMFLLIPATGLMLKARRKIRCAVSN